MSQPAARAIHQRTTDCPTCGASRYRPCMRLDGPDHLRLYEEHGANVSPHAARLRAERALAEQRRLERASR